MKLFILATAAAMTFGGSAAMAQTAPAPAPEAPAPAPEPPVAEQPVTTVTTTTDATGAPVSTTINVASPGNYTPPPPADPPASYPLCTRTVTDHCRQRGG